MDQGPGFGLFLFVLTPEARGRGAKFITQYMYIYCTAVSAMKVREAKEETGQRVQVPVIHTVPVTLQVHTWCVTNTLLPNLPMCRRAMTVRDLSSVFARRVHRTVMWLTYWKRQIGSLCFWTDPFHLNGWEGWVMWCEGGWVSVWNKGQDEEKKRQGNCNRETQCQVQRREEVAMYNKTVSTEGFLRNS